MVVTPQPPDKINGYRQNKKIAKCGEKKKNYRANRPRNITRNSSIKTKIAVNMNSLYIQTHSQKLLELAQLKTNKKKQPNHIRMTNKYINIFAVT